LFCRRLAIAASCAIGLAWVQLVTHGPMVDRVGGPVNTMPAKTDEQRAS
jgi:hypothetical protein